MSVRKAVMGAVFRGPVLPGVAVVLCAVLVSTQAQPATSAPKDAGTKTGTPTPKGTTNIKVRVLLEKPFVMKTDRPDPTHYEGLLVDVLDYVTTRSNISYEISPLPHTMYGYEHSPGNWTGLVGALVKQEVDLVVAPLTIVSRRQTAVDFTLPVMSAGLRILYKPTDPGTADDSFFLMLSPFTVGMWVVLLLMFVVVSLLFYVIGRFSPYEDHAFVGRAATYEGLTLPNSFLYVFSSFTFQGYTAAPRSMSGRVLAAFWWVFVLLTVAAYTASLCSIFLAFRPSLTSLPFATFDELSQQSHVAYGIVRNGATQRYLSTSQRAVQRRLWGTINAHADDVMVSSISEGIHRVRTRPGQYALIMEGPMAEYVSEQAPCDLMTVGEELNEHYWGFACQKGSDVCPRLNTAILQMKEEDHIFDLKKKWLHQGCNRDDTAEYIYQGVSYLDTFGTTPKYYADRSVTLRRFGMGFLGIVIGMALSACLLFAEIFIAKRRGSPVPQRMPRGREDLERIDREYKDEDN